MSAIIGGLLPNGKQQFFNGVGVPLANGTVTFYIPGTTTPKDTYLDYELTTKNANPVTLDGNGMWSIWGVGQYRQVVADENANQIWDQVTSSQPISLTAQDTGSANAYACSLAGVPTLALIQGQVLYLSVLNTNAGASTLNVNSLGAVTVLGGAGGTLASGQLVAGSIVPLIYNGTAWQLVACGVATSGTLSIGDVVDTAATSVAAPWYMCYGQALSRSTYANAFAVLGTQFGAGDGSTTFNLPDCRGRARFGADAMGGTAASRLTTASLGGSVGAIVGAAGGNENVQFHGHGVSLNETGHQHGIPAGYNYYSGSPPGAAANAATTTIYYNSTSCETVAAVTGITVNQSNYGAGFSLNLPPAIVFNTKIYLGQ